MPFNFVSVSKDTVLAKSSRNLYRSLLNKLSKEGYTTQQELIDNSEDIIKYIDDLYGDDKRAKRVMLSAVFYILCDTEYIKSPNDYHTYFQDQREVFLPK